jgi:hypothetical protein
MGMATGMKKQNEPYTDEGAAVDWSEVSMEAATTILRQGELYLDGQSRLALAADQRALSAASVFSGFAGVVLAATLGYWAETHRIDLLAAGFVMTGMMLAGAFSCMVAAWPVAFALPGNEPKQWWAVRTKPLNMVIGGETENYQTLIDINISILTKNARWLKFGLAFGVSAPFGGALAWFAMQAIEFFVQSHPA